LQPPPLDRNIGMTVYATPYEGIGGRLRVKLEDFWVNEVLDDVIFKHLSEMRGTRGPYVIYSLTKRGLDTIHAVKIVEKAFGARVNYLGIKDANAVTTQYISVPANADLNLSKLQDRLMLEKLGYLTYPLNRSHLIGNKFKVKVREVTRRENLAPILDTMVENGVPNFFGYQRFGSRRPVTHLVGKAFAKRQFDKAIELLLTYSSEYESAGVQQARRIMVEENLDVDVEELPPVMDLEKMVLRSLKKHPNNYIKALEQIPLRVRRLFLNAYQSYIFNRTLSAALEDGLNLLSVQHSDLYAEVDGVKILEVKKSEGRIAQDRNKKVVLLCPLVGYNFKEKNFGRLGAYASKILLEEEVTPKDFYIDDMPELSVGGDLRAATLLFDELHTDISEEALSLEAILGKGGYITSLLREIMKPEDPVKAGF